MKKLIFLLLTFLTTFFTFGQVSNNNINDQEMTTDNYLNTIRDNKALLRLFFQKMPKGGDLHHHYDGSVYAETYLDIVEKENWWINTLTFDVSEKDYNNLALKKEWQQVNTLKKQGKWFENQLNIIKAWSVKHYVDNGVNLPSDEHFFSTFLKFMPAKNKTYKAGLLEIKERAIKENTAYIETIFTLPEFTSSFDFEQGLNERMFHLQNNKNEEIQSIFSYFYQNLIQQEDYLNLAIKNKEFVEKWHNDLKIDNDNFTMRYQNYVLRIKPPVDVFKDMLLAFKSADLSDYIVGVNIVAPENNKISMRDYWLHMQMFRFFNQKFPNVKYSLHAGELVLGLVQPEKLTGHINDALHIAKAQRIGHGVDIMHEENALEILKFMQEKEIAVEINLSSNEFILGLSAQQHPIIIYQKAGVPIVISTDDAGVLRTDLTHQYVLLAQNQPSISYQNIKQYVFNSIKYSFLPTEKKEKLKAKLVLDFAQFEKDISDFYVK